MTQITPHDIAQLAETRRRDPELALKIAEQSAAQSAPRLTLNTKPKAEQP